MRRDRREPRVSSTTSPAGAPATEAPTSAPDVARAHGLARVGVRPHLIPYVLQVWSRRHFAWMLARSRVAARSEGDFLGAFWNVLRPLLTAGVYLLVFGYILGTKNNTPNFEAFLTIGVFVFTFIASCVTSGAKAITGNLNLVRALHFPRAVLPLSTTLDELISMGPVIVIMVAVTLITGEPVAWSWLLLVPAMLLTAAFAFGLALIFARMTSVVRDVAQLLPFATRMWLYLSGVFYSIDRFQGTPILEKLLALNPAHIFISLFRGALLEEYHITGGLWLGAIAWAVGSFAVGVMYFWRGEGTYGRG